MIRVTRFACRSTKATRTTISSAITRTWRSVRRRPLAARRNAWSIRITLDRKPNAATVKNGLSRIEGRSISPPGIPPAAYAHLSPAIATQRERPRRRRFRGLQRVGPQAAPGSFDLGFAGALAASPLLGGGRTVFCHVVAHDRT